MDVDVAVGHALDWALVGRLVGDTADARHLEDAFVVGSHGHALALGHRVEKVAEEVVVVYETVGFRDKRNVDRM